MPAIAGTVLSFMARNWLHIAIAIGLAFAVWKIDQNGYQRAERAAQEREERILAEVKEMEKRVAERIAEIDADLSAKIAGIDAEERTIIVPTLTKEIASDPRFSNPAAGITDGMRNAINRARALSSAPIGLDSGPVSSSGDVE